MKFSYRKPGVLLLSALLVMPGWANLSAQELEPIDSDAATDITVTGTIPADLSSMPEGPEIEGFISARIANGIRVNTATGASSEVLISDGTEIRGTGGFLGLGRKEAAADSLLNGLPVTVKTVRWGGNLVASEVRFKNNDLKTAAMIQSGTSQRFDEQGRAIGENAVAISENAAATEALRGRLGDIDKYNIKSTTNVYFDSGKSALSAQSKIQLCAAASEAEGMENSLLLVVGYTDSTGSPEINQRLSEQRAGNVVNYLQQACGWKPYRMLTPTGMASADPQASNNTEYGKAQNRRVSVNVLVSKGLDGI